MDALHIDVFQQQPSSSSKSDVEEKTSYEQVSYSEVLFPNFQRLRRLGRGSYGTVVECQFRNKLAAAKLVEMTIDHVHIHNEAKLLHDFKHDNIIKLYAVFHGEQTGLVLELMEGGSLNELLHQKLHIQYQACHALGWALQVTSALTYLHSLGYVHRDLKPSNMLLTADYMTLKLCDFGTAAELRTSMTNNRGSAAWMAPEVFRGKKYDQKCDIFSFGILLWEIVTRKQPFDDWDNNTYTILWQVSEGRRPNNIQGECPEPLLDLIRRCWSDDPKERPYIGEVNAIVEIYPNRFLPLIDLTSGQQALAERGEYYGQHFYLLPPLTQPPARPPPSSGHRRGNSHDYRFNNLNQLYASPSGQECHSANEVTNLSPAALPGYFPNTSRPSYNFQISTPLPNACPYNPCLTSAGGQHAQIIAPVLPPLMVTSQNSSQSTQSIHSTTSNCLSAIIKNAPVYTSERFSEPPATENDSRYSAYGSHHPDKRKKRNLSSLKIVLDATYRRPY